MCDDRLSGAELDALREISRIGMSQAATALSQLLGERVVLNVPRIAHADAGEIADLLGGAEKLAIGVTLKILGDAQGRMLLILPRQSAALLLERLLGVPQEGLVLSEIGASALREVANILASAYLSALGGRLGLTLLPSVPALAGDLASSVTHTVLHELRHSGERALLLETEFSSGDGDAVCGDLFVLPTPASLALFLQSFGNGS